MTDRNANRPGYKKTKLGWIPEAWKCVKLSKYIILLSGQHINSSQYNTVGNGIPYLTGPMDYPDGQIFLTKFTSYPRVLCKEGDILITCKGSGTGTIAVANQAYCISRQIMAVRQNGINSNYLFYLLKRKQSTFKSSAVGLIPGITRSTINRISVLLPPTQEQQKIAEILLTWDRVIEQLRKLIEAKKRLKKALMKKLFTGKMRLTGFNEPWQNTSLGKLVDVNKNVLSESTDPSYQFYYLDLSQVNKGRISYPDKLIRFDKSPSRARRIVSNGDIVMSTVRPNLQGFGIIRQQIDNLVCSTGFAVLSPTENSCIEFVYNLLFSSIVGRQLMGLIAGSNYPAITSNDVSNLKIPHPSIEEQRQIAEILQTCDEEIHQLEQQLEAYQHQKKGLMQKLLTGEIRVKTEEKPDE